MGEEEEQQKHEVNFGAPRKFAKSFKSDLKETFLPDDPFRSYKNESKIVQAKKTVQYFFPIFEWLPRYNLKLFWADLLAGITIASLAIPQGISYAKLAQIPPIIGLYSSFVPPLIYAVFGSSKDLAIGTVASCSLLFPAIIGRVVPPTNDPSLYLHLVYTATFFAGVLQAGLGIFRLGFLVDFLSHSTILGFMTGTAIIIALQQFKAMFGLTKFTTHTDVVSVLHAIFAQFHQWQWRPAVMGFVFLAFLIFTRHLKKKNPKLFWVPAISPMVVVVVGALFVYFTKANFQTVGDLKKGLNPISIHYLNFNSKYLSSTVQAGVITGILSLAEGIAIGRSFATMRNYQTDGNKEMTAIGLMNIVGSFTSCYLATGPFSKTAVNNSAGCKTAMSNVVMALCMMLTLLFIAPLFSYTPLVALSALIISAMLGLIAHEEIYHLLQVDKFDFIIAVSAVLGITFVSMDVGLGISVGLSILRALLYVARPSICKLGNIPNTKFYRDMHQYPCATRVKDVLILQLGSPLYFSNSSYIRERIFRWIEEEQGNQHEVHYLVLDMGGSTNIDTSGIEMFTELKKMVEKRGVKIMLANPRLEVTEKLILSGFIDDIGKKSVFLSIDDAVAASKFKLIEDFNSKHYSERVVSNAADKDLSDAQVVNMEEGNGSSENKKGGDSQ
ncbi:hypothetical protein Scep_008239 [Stephania cephalantha]|uniref:STAS domain-containing protein n=1 Tax=Stephania cephalantha TaxID=152367 RepID=A0AAP0PMI8_9MAGN